MPAFAGAEGRFEDYVYLAMLEHEWKRPEASHDWLDGIQEGERPSIRAGVVLLFWTYFETRVERILRQGLEGAPSALVEDVLARYSSIGARLDRLYRIVFSSTYQRDLTELGFDDIWRHLRRVQVQRNAFVHGDPKGIDDDLVSSVVAYLKREHEAWIGVFNLRVERKRAA